MDTYGGPRSGNTEQVDAYWGGLGLVTLNRWMHTRGLGLVTLNRWIHTRGARSGNTEQVDTYWGGSVW